MNAVLPTIRSLGANLVVISPQLATVSAKLKTELGLDFDILVDAGSAVAREFGLAMSLPPELIDVYRKIGVDLVKFNGDELWTLPVPARIVADASGNVRAIEADPDYTVRPEPEVTVDALRSFIT